MISLCTVFHRHQARRPTLVNAFRVLKIAENFQKAYRRVMDYYFWLKYTGFLESYRADSDTLIASNA